MPLPDLLLLSSSTPLSCSQLLPPFLDWPHGNAVTPAAPVTLALGQENAVTALRMALSGYCRDQHLFLASHCGFDDEALIADLLQSALGGDQHAHQQWLRDWLYLPHWQQVQAPRLLPLPAGSARSFISALEQYLAVIGSPDAESQFEQLLQQFGPDQNLQDFLTELVLHKSLRERLHDELAVLVSHPAGRFPLYHSVRLSEARLFGDVRYESHKGTILTHARLLVPGLLHLANGGALVIRAEQLLENPELWPRLRAVLSTGQLDWQAAEATTIATGFSPEPVPISVKLILLGERGHWPELEAMDPQIREFLPLLVDLKPWLDISQAADLQNYLELITAIAKRRELPPLQAEALLRLAAWASREVNDNQRVTLASKDIEILLTQAAWLASQTQAAQISAEHIDSALLQRRQRAQLIGSEHYRAIHNGQIRLQFSGWQVGQSNGLSVIEAAGEMFGEPTRISATIHHGEGDIIDVERRVELGGNLHAKGMMIISAFIHHHFGQHGPLPLAAHIVLEQSYFDVDGDSASLAALLALLSAIAGQPLAQRFAITGAIDQHGQVLAIGGINEKIEGWWRVASAVASDEPLAVIMPAANAGQLNLDADVRQAVANGQLQIHAIDQLAEAIALVMAIDAGSADDDGDYPPESLFGRIQGQLRAMAEDDRNWWQRLWPARGR